jgi:hypothetical protein
MCHFTKLKRQIAPPIVQFSKCGKNRKITLYNFSLLKYNADIKQLTHTFERMVNYEKVICNASGPADGT